jgi:hypothetical protein
MFGLRKQKSVIDMDLKLNVEKILESSKHTPDLLQLSRWETQLVFLPDEFQVDHPKHELIKEHSFYCCNAETLSPFAVYKRSLGEESYPLPFRTQNSFFNATAWANPKKGDAGAVRGEIHAVNPRTFFPIVDKARQNTVQFERERVDLMVKYWYRSFSRRDGWHMSEEKITFLEAWMYVAKPEYWGEVPLSELKAVRMFVPNNPYKHIAPYYKFTKLEYDDV